MKLRTRGETHSDLVKLAEFQRAVAVDGWPDVLAVLAVFDQLQLPDTADVSQSGLDLCHVQHLERKLTEIQDPHTIISPL